NRVTERARPTPAAPTLAAAALQDIVVSPAITVIRLSDTPSRTSACRAGPTSGRPMMAQRISGAASSAVHVTPGFGVGTVPNRDAKAPAQAGHTRKTVESITPPVISSPNTIGLGTWVRVVEARREISGSIRPADSDSPAITSRVTTSGVIVDLDDSPPSAWTCAGCAPRSRRRPGVHRPPRAVRA